jgi:hypothetical protein
MQHSHPRNTIPTRSGPNSSCHDREERGDLGEFRPFLTVSWVHNGLKQPRHNECRPDQVKRRVSDAYGEGLKVWRHFHWPYPDSHFDLFPFVQQ